MRLALFYLSVFAICTSYVDAGRILALFPHPGRSHKMVFEPFLRHLAELGHQVTVVSFFPEKNPPKNYTDVDLSELASARLESQDLIEFEDAKSSNVPGINVIKRILKQMNEFEFLAAMGLDVCSKLVNFKPLNDTLTKEYDLVLVENFNSDCMLGLAHVYGVKAPVVSVLSCSYMPWSADRIGAVDNPAYVPVISNAFTPEMNFLQRLENTFLYVYYKIWYRYRIQAAEQAMIEKKFGEMPDLGAISKNISLMMVNTFHSLTGAQPIVPGVIEVGGLHLETSNKPLPKYIERFLNESEHGVIVMSFGSLLRSATMPQYKQDIFIEVLSKLKQRVIWKFEDSGEEGTMIGNNILRVRWLPQYQLLQHHKVVAFIAHGGMLGMTEAIAAGKPMLVMPFFGDQPFNGAAAERAGLGVVTSYPDLTAESLGAALRAVLSGATRRSARRAAALWRDRPLAPLACAQYWVERALRWGRGAPQHSAARDLPLLQAALLDLAAALLAPPALAALLLRAARRACRASGARTTHKHKAQ